MPRTFFNRHASTQGFTLIELLVTIAVASILLSVAVPSFQSMIVNNRLTTQSNDFVSAINLARSEAIKRNSSVSFCRAANEAATTCATSVGDWGHWIVRSASGTVVRRGTINTYGGGIDVTSTLTADTAEFGSDGLGRTGGSLVSDHQINVCAPDGGATNIRRVILGAGSRISTATLKGAC